MIEPQVDRRKTLRAQISGYLRDAILRGEIEAGSTLPSTPELARKWGTQTANVHAALTLLVQEGLLTRKNGVGTIVNSRKERLQTVLIYQGVNLSTSPQNFYRRILLCITEELTKIGIQYRIINDDEKNDHFAQIRELAEKGLIQGVIAMSIGRSERTTLKKLPVPFSCITTGKIKNRVSLSFNSLAEKVRDGLLRQNCSKVGMLLSIGVEESRDSGTNERKNFVSNLTKLLNESGVEVRDEWIYTSDRDPEMSRTEPDQFAYRGFNHIWSSKDKPDGLFVYTDTLIPGTLISILSKRIMVPEQLKLVLHRNSECDVLCPVPCYFVENNVREMAFGLVQLIVDQYNGRAVSQIDFEYRLIDNTKEAGEK